jgi:protein-S-isoprenylcysteine O-methyltransferase Ste14
MISLYAYYFCKSAVVAWRDFPNLLVGVWNLQTLCVTLTQLQYFATIVLSLVVVVALIKRHPPIARTPSYAMKLVAIAGTMSPILFWGIQPIPVSVAIYLTSGLLILIGTIIMVVGFWGLGDSIGVIPDVRRLKTGGIYSLIRHPIYLGELISLLGLVLTCNSRPAWMLFLLCAGLQYLRLIFEERVLREKILDYRAYAAQTWRLIPYVY